MVLKTIKAFFLTLHAALTDVEYRSQPAPKNIQPSVAPQPKTSEAPNTTQKVGMKPMLNPFVKSLLRQGLFDILCGLPEYLNLRAPFTSLRVSVKESFVVCRIPLSPTNRISPAEYSDIVAELNNTCKNVVEAALDKLRTQIYDDAYAWYIEALQHWNTDWVEWSQRADIGYLRSYQLLYSHTRKNLICLNVAKVECTGNTLLVFCQPYFNTAYRPDSYWMLANHAMCGYCI